MFFSLPECYFFDTDFFGGGIGAQLDVADHIACQQLCQNMADCNYFSCGEGDHANINVRKKCHFKSVKNSEDPSAKVISGPKNCP